MVTILRALLVLSTAMAILGGCDSKPKNEPPPAKLFKEDRDALEKAKGVQQTVDQQSEETKKKIEEQSK